MINFIDCIVCKEYIDKGTCNAFPDGIPNGILQGSISHKENVKGDNGIKFSLDPKYKNMKKAL